MPAINYSDNLTGYSMIVTTVEVSVQWIVEGMVWIGDVRLG